MCPTVTDNPTNIYTSFFFYFFYCFDSRGSSTTKNKKDLIEAYSYFGYYHYLQSKDGKIQSEVTTSKSFWEKVLALDPNDERAKAAIQALTAPQQPKNQNPKGKR